MANISTGVHATGPWQQNQANEKLKGQLKWNWPEEPNIDLPLISL